MSEKSLMHGSGESYRGIDREAVERRRGRTEGDRGGKAVDQGERGTAQPVPDAESGERAQRAGPCMSSNCKGDQKMRFTALLHHVNVDLLPQQLSTTWRGERRREWMR